MNLQALLDADAILSRRFTKQLYRAAALTWYMRPLPPSVSSKLPSNSSSGPTGRKTVGVLGSAMKPVSKFSKLPVGRIPQSGAEPKL